nr:hypothetical protein Iba_chr09cCG7820 [Ipomoea batatas]
MISLRVSNELGTREKNMVADILAKQTHVSNTTSMEWEELPPSIKDSSLLDLSTLPCVRIISEGCPIRRMTEVLCSCSITGIERKISNKGYEEAARRCCYHGLHAPLLAIQPTDLPVGGRNCMLAIIQEHDERSSSLLSSLFLFDPKRPQIASSVPNLSFPNLQILKALKECFKIHSLPDASPRPPPPSLHLLYQPHHRHCRCLPLQMKSCRKQDRLQVVASSCMQWETIDDQHAYISEGFSFAIA